ncbi:vitamin D-binding protein [Silurus meridionalis]|uniref:vitamin D-binding protein n=1 Tax=Silurus meridionalis TaxID=175797 RepID=UPI001EEAD7E0|nr:vitamin D-binding protein [Silurus meridionalis]
MNSPLVEPTPEEICTQYTNNHSNYVLRYLFQIGVKHVSVSLPVLTTIQDQMRSTVAACRSGINDTAACLKESKLEKAAAVVDNFCSQYFKMELPAFKTKNHLEFQGNEPKSQAWIDLTTSCCFQH